MSTEHHLSIETPILYLNSKEAFDGLTEREKSYAHHMSKASWWGGLIVPCQTSPESPTIFSMLMRLFRSEPLNSLKETAVTKADFSEDEFKLLCIYANTFLYNLGNYLGFGDRKFIPSVSKEKLQKLIKASKAYEKHPDVMDKYTEKCLDVMYDITEAKRFLGLPESGVTTYFTPNCTKADSDLATEYMVARNLEGWNSRLCKVVKDEETVYEIKLASVDGGLAEGITLEEDEYEGHKFRITRGDHSVILEEMNKELEKAKDFAANDLERSMLTKYMESFKSGSQQKHKDGSIDWVNNKSPAIETYTGFIEVYRDPSNQRAEFESFVAAVNREQSRKFDTLVRKAPEFLALLPWGKDFEEDVFSKPDYSALDIITFASSGLPIGINIPNYKEVKEEHGFKNVTLSNVVSARSSLKGNPFLSSEDEKLKEKFSALGLEIAVGLHELLGHGSGKFLRRKADGTLNFDVEKVKNPFTGEAAGFYETGENYQTVFGEISSSYEECRAEGVALHLSLNEDVHDIFEIDPKDRSDVTYVQWLDMMYGGLKGIEMYQPSQGKWGQAHCQARYVLLRVVLEAGQDLLSIEETVGEDGLPDLKLSLDRSKIDTVGKEAIAKFLKKMQVYRSMGDGKSATEMYDRYSNVPKDGPHPFERWHEILIRKRKPRMILTMPNTREGDQIEIVSYPDGHEGNLESWVQRFTPEQYELIENYLTNYKLH